MSETKKFTKTRGFKISLIAAILVIAILATALIVIFLNDEDEYDEGFWLLTEDIGDYVSLKADDYKKAVLTIDAVEQIKMEDVEKYIRNAQIEAYTGKTDKFEHEGVVREDDSVALWYRGEVNIGTAEAPQWVEFLGGSNYHDTASYALRIGSGNFIPGFEDALKGIDIKNMGILVYKDKDNVVGSVANAETDIVYISYNYSYTDEDGKTKTGTMTDRVDLNKDGDSYIGVSRYSNALRDSLWGLHAQSYVKTADGKLATFEESFDMTQDLKPETVKLSNVRVVGIVVKENVQTIDVAFPTPYSNNPDLAGKTARWYVAIDSISRPTDLPAIENVDYSFVSTKLGVTYQSLLALSGEDAILTEAEINEIGSDKAKQEAAVIANYKTYIFEAMKEQREAKITQAIQSAFWEYIIEKVEVKKYPEELLSQYISAMKANAQAEFDEYTETAGNPSVSSLAEYLVNNYDAKYFPNTSKIEEGFEMMAKEQLRSEMALYYIAAAERLTMSKRERDEIAEKEMAELIEYYTAYYQSMGQLSEDESFTEQDLVNGGITRRTIVENAYLSRVNEYIGNTLREYVEFKDAEAE